MNIITASHIKGRVTAPASKSMLQRYVALALLTEGTSTLHATGHCDDCLVSFQAAKALGAEVFDTGSSIIITGKRNPPKETLWCGESGTSVRIFAAIAALNNFPITVSGSGTLMTRPMEMITEPLQALGAQCELSDGKLPMKITGPLKSGVVTLDGSITSQFLSGLLITLPTIPGDSKITALHLKSRPYIDMTLDAIEAFGGRIDRSDDTFIIHGNQRYRPQTLSVEGDWSGASFLLVAGAIGGSVTVTGLREDSRQGDKAIIEALKHCGASVLFENGGVQTTSDTLRSFSFDATHCPDLFPPLCALASACQGTSRIRGVKRLLHKESNRAIALQSEFQKLGIKVTIDEDTMSVTGGIPHGGVSVDAHGDHRIAMACGIASIRAQQPVEILGSESVQKSYPSFFTDLEKLRGNHE